MPSLDLFLEDEELRFTTISCMKLSVYITSVKLLENDITALRDNTDVL